MTEEHIEHVHSRNAVDGVVVCDANVDAEAVRFSRRDALGEVRDDYLACCVRAGRKHDVVGPGDVELTLWNDAYLS
jgi:hypothetical protein